MPTVLDLAAVIRAGGYNTMHSLPLKREDMYPMLMTVLLLYVSQQMLKFLSTSPRGVDRVPASEPSPEPPIPQRKR